MKLTAQVIIIMMISSYYRDHHAQVLGLGPVFRLILGLTNTSASTPSRGLFITFYCDDKLYRIAKPYIDVSMLVPGLDYKYETLVECVSEMGVADQIRLGVRMPVYENLSVMLLIVRVFVSRQERTQPILTACINMPVPEMV